jgi:hypothetical protein
LVSNWYPIRPPDIEFVQGGTRHAPIFMAGVWAIPDSFHSTDAAEREFSAPTRRQAYSEREESS